MALHIIIALVIGYFLGSIPFAYIVARLKKGIDIRKTGGGNVGALNVYRNVGPVFGLIVLATDLAKGVLAVLIAQWLSLPLIWTCVAGFAAVVGHNWPCFLGFRGGRGAATIMGVLIPLIPLQFLIGFVIAAIAIMITSNVRVGIIGIALMPLITWLFDKPSILVFFSLALFVFLIIVVLPSFVKEMIKTADKKSLIFERNYHFWQTKRKKE